MTVWVLSLALLAASPRPPAAERAIEIGAPGRISVVLDRDVYRIARTDLSDLRVLDSHDRLVPYVLDLGQPRLERDSPRIIDRGFQRGESESAVLDFGKRVLKREIGLSLSGENFRRQVVVEGSDDGQAFTTLTYTAYVFAVPPPAAARYETVPFPENDQRYLRVSVFRGEGDPDRIEIRDAWATVEEQRQGPTAELVPRMTTAEDPRRRETVLTLDLGARAQPFRGLALDVDDPRFMRGALLEALRSPAHPRPSEEPQPVSWATLGTGCLYRYAEGGRTRQSLRLDISGREEVIRLRIPNGDDRPLQIRSCVVLVPVERVVFEAAAGETYRLTYGQEELRGPEFDLARTVGPLDRWTQEAVPGRLGPAAGKGAPASPWTERHPALLFGGLLGAVAVLGLLTWRALKTTGA